MTEFRFHTKLLAR
uniref:Uncharacterized protein n=1 Tax=Arundo donax TaxID=35708 RepID=A0A0A8ZGD4_ARUDO